MNCAKSGQANFVRILVEGGANPNTGGFRTPLQWSLMTGKEDVVEALVDAGVDLNFGNPPPVTIAASLGRINSVKLFIQNNVDLSKEVSFIQLMMFAFIFVFSFIYTSHDVFGINLYHVSFFYRFRTALDLAENFNREEIVQLLKEAGAKHGKNPILAH